MSFWDKFKPNDSFDYKINNERVIENVKQAGYEVIEADDHHLLLDIDTEEQYAIFKDCFKLFQQFFEGEVIKHERRTSIGGLPGIHIIITLSVPIDALERVAWQACLGSDPKREFYNLLGIHFGIPHHIVLFNKKRIFKTIGTPTRRLGVREINFTDDDDIPF